MQAAAKDYSSLIGLLIAFFFPCFSFIIFYLFIYVFCPETFQKPTFFFFYFCMAMGSRGNPLEASAMLHCTYNNSNRVMTLGNVRAVKVILSASVQDV